MNDFENRKIIIRDFSYGPDFYKKLQMSDTVISIYYYLPDIDENVKEGYVIEAKIKAVKIPKIKYISKDYFDNIYNEFNKIDFELLALKALDGCDGGGLEIEMGIYKGLINSTKKLLLWCPSIDKENKKSELNKLLILIENIKKEINFNEWYKKIYKEWERWENKIEQYREIFEYDNNW
ncbi:MAG: hypothetical protein FWG77_11720 [Treponema sp.]|nr:hypothetical protein [Treponema sp.]